MANVVYKSGHVDVLGSANNKAKTLRMEHVKGRKFTGKKKIKALLGMLARLPWETRYVRLNECKTRRSVC